MDNIVGSEIGGCQIEALIGKGGMGAVYKGIQLSLKRPVAVKILSDAVKDNEQYISRFLREAQIIARVSHPNIIQIFDTGKKDDTYYILMEFVEGRSLSSIVKEDGPQSLERVTDICIQAVRGLKAAWENEVIHRDIKPDNILIMPDNSVKIADFGLAKGTGEIDTLTVTGQVMGTPAFMSPEQCRGEETDFRTDIYSLGITLYSMLTGSVPFSGSNTAEIIFKHINSAIPKISETMEIEGAANVDFILRNCLAKDKSNRYQNYDVFLANLEALKQGKDLQGPFEQPTIDMATKVSPAAQGKYTCPECSHRFDDDPDFYNEVGCPQCSFRFKVGGDGDGDGGGDDDPGFKNDQPQQEGQSLVSAMYARSDTSQTIEATSASAAAEESLDDRIRRVILIQPRDAIELMIKIIETIRKSSGPPNLLLPEKINLAPDGMIKVADCDLPFVDLSPAQAVYASPELCRADPITPASAAYSLGMIMAYMLSGHPAVDSPHLEKIKSFHLEERRLNVGRLNPTMSETLALIVSRMSGFNDEPRFESVATIEELLSNELKRMDGEEVFDEITGGSPVVKQEPIEEKPEPEIAAAPAAAARIICSACGNHNAATAYVCASCAHLLREENPSAAPVTEKDYLHVAMELYNRHNYENAQMVCNEGMGKHFGSGNLRELSGKIEKAMSAKQVQLIEDKAAEFASQKKFKQAIQHWNKAGMIAPESKTKHFEKVGWAKGQLRKRRLKAAAILLILLLAAGTGAAWYYRLQLLPPVNAFLRRFNIRLAWLEKQEPKGLDTIDFSQPMDLPAIYAHLDKVQGRALSDAEAKNLSRLRGLVLERVGTEVSRLRCAPFMEVHAGASAYLKDTPEEEQLEGLKLQSLQMLLDRIGAAEEDPAGAQKELKAAASFADGTALAEEFERRIETIELALKKKEGESEIGQARRELKKGRVLERQGRLTDALKIYRFLPEIYTDPELYGKITEEARLGAKRIETYEHKARKILIQADARVARDEAGALILYNQILKEYPHAEAASALRIPMQITSLPAGADIFVNDEGLGKTPARITVPPRGDALISIHLKGYMECRIRTADHPYTPGRKWALHTELMRAPDRIIDSGVILVGMAQLGDGLFAAGPRGVTGFYPFDSDQDIKHFPYPEGLPGEGRNSVGYVAFPEGYNFGITKNASLLRFEPIMERISLLGTLDIPPGEPMHIFRFFPENRQGLFFRDDKGKLYCYDLKTMSRRWTKKYGRDYKGADVASFKKMLITGDLKGRGIAFFDKDSGDSEHLIRMPAMQHFLRVEDEELIAADPAGTLIRVNLPQGFKIKWQVRVPGISIAGAPIITGTRLYVLTTGGTVISLFRRNGEEEWRQKLGDKPLEGGCFFKNSIYIHDSYGTIYKLDAQGKIHDRLYGESRITSGLLPYKDRLFFISKKGQLVIYRLK